MPRLLLLLLALLLARPPTTHAAAGPNASVQNVLEMNDRCADCMTSDFPTTAAMGIPLPKALPNTATSGITL